ncbi:MAG: hypothetical protein EA427_03330 [Spirochaetaceae bacterium]|nr:MAG: hypothetical protein EA427_03330 [Spirochaetaceae bacterium]
MVNSLKKVERNTEEVFLELAQALPELVREMRKSLDVSEETISAMEKGTASAGAGTVQGLVSRTNEAVIHWAEQFRLLAERDATIFEQLHRAIGKLEEISRSINHIRLDSEDMEIVSLNAMTVALKAGNAGRAFSYITEELKRLSNRTVALSEKVSANGKELIDSFTLLQAELEETRTIQKSFLETFRTRITRSFEDFERAVRTMIEGSRDLRQRSTDLQSPINRMMEAIQLQDLIRQSIDHIVLALDVIKPEDSLDTAENLLDELAFLRDIPRLGISLIEDVARQIDESTDTFFSLTEEAETQLDELEQERRDFMSGTIRVRGNQDVSFSQLMNEMSAILDELVLDLNGYLKRKEQLAARSAAITGNVEQLQGSFRTFQTLVNRFHSIDIAARIEVAKQTVLRSMGNSTDQMTALTRKIGQDVENSLAVTRDFIASTSTVMDSYREAYREEALFAGRFQADMHQHYRLLQEGWERITGVVGEFSLFTDQFFTVFSRSKENGAKLRDTAREIRGLKDDLEMMEQSIQHRYEEALKKSGLGEWKIGDARLKEIIERFTIFTHKQQAGDLAGFDVEQGAASGDVTLF